MAPHHRPPTLLAAAPDAICLVHAGLLVVLTPSLHASPSRPSRLLGFPPHPSRYEACCTIASVWSNRAAPRSTCTALLGRQKLTIKKNLRKFCGFAGGDVELKKKAELLKKMDGKLIKKVLEVCDLQLSGTKAESIDRLLAFLSKPEASGARRVQTVGRAVRGGSRPFAARRPFWLKDVGHMERPVGPILGAAHWRGLAASLHFLSILIKLCPRGGAGLCVGAHLYPPLRKSLL